MVPFLNLIEFTPEIFKKKFGTMEKTFKRATEDRKKSPADGEVNQAKKPSEQESEKRAR